MMPLKIIDFNFALEFEIVFLILGKSVISLHISRYVLYIHHLLLCHK